MATAPADLDRRERHSPVGQLLAHWRGVRRMSQLTLASEAQVSPRHVSFVESGRSRPSAAMVLTLARALDVPLRERNQMLLAAGHAPVYPQADLDSPAMAPVRAAIDRILGHHPFPAVVKDRHWNLVTANEPAGALFGWLLGERASEPANVVRLMFDPHGLRPHVANWDEVAEMLIQRVHREAVGGASDPDTQDLLDEALAQPGVPDGMAHARLRAGADAHASHRVQQGRAHRQLLLHGDDAGDPARHHRPGAADRELLPGGRRHRAPPLGGWPEAIAATDRLPRQ